MHGLDAIGPVLAQVQGCGAPFSACDNTGALAACLDHPSDQSFRPVSLDMFRCLARVVGPPCAWILSSVSSRLLTRLLPPACSLLYKTSPYKPIVPAHVVRVRLIVPIHRQPAADYMMPLGNHVRIWHFVLFYSDIFFYSHWKKLQTRQDQNHLPWFWLFFFTCSLQALLLAHLHVGLAFNTQPPRHFERHACGRFVHLWHVVVWASLFSFRHHSQTWTELMPHVSHFFSGFVTKALPDVQCEHWNIFLDSLNIIIFSD